MADGSLRSASRRVGLAVPVVAVGVLAAFLPDLRWYFAAVVVVLIAGMTVLDRWLADRQAADAADEREYTLPPHQGALPTRPEQFVGRSHDRALSDLRSFAARPGFAAVRGQPGSGKTTVCRALIHHPTIAKTYADSRYWIDLDQVSSADARARICERVGHEGWPQLLRSLQRAPATLLVLDNSDDCWLFDARTPDPILTDLATVGGQLRVVVAYRGHEQPPSGPDWRAVVEPGLLLDGEADALFGLIAPDHREHPRRSELISRWGELPLAVTLLAKLVADQSSTLVEQLADGALSSDLRATHDGRTGSLAWSLDRSIAAVSDNDRAVLGALAMFRDGLDEVDAEVVLAHLHLPKLSMPRLHARGLLTVGGAGYRSLPPIREHISALPALVPPPEQLLAMRQRFIEQAVTMAGGEPSLAGEWVTRNRRNLLDALNAVPDDIADKVALALIRLPLNPAAASAFNQALSAILDRATISADASNGDELAKHAEELRFQHRLSEAAQIYLVVLRIRHRLNDRHAEAVTLKRLGDIAFQQSRYAEARSRYNEAIGMSRAIGDQASEASALRGLGCVAYYQDCYEEARGLCNEALKIFRLVGDRQGEAHSVRDLAVVDQTDGRHEDARNRYIEALSIFRDISDRDGEAHTLLGLGAVDLNQNRYGAAHIRYDDALAIFRVTRNSDGEAKALSGLGNVDHAENRDESARKHYDGALAIFRAIGDRLSEARAVQGLGHVAHTQNRPDDARRHFEQALAIHRDIGNGIGEAKALYGLGVNAYTQNRHDDARRHYDGALAIFRAIGSRVDEANVLQGLGKVCHAQTRHEEARKHFDDALAINRETGDRLGKARTLAASGRLSLSSGQVERAHSEFTSDAELLAEIGDRQAGHELANAARTAPAAQERSRIGWLAVEQLERSGATVEAQALISELVLAPTHTVLRERNEPTLQGDG